jgi:tripartite-type tricarboxylate transporter receptor subunit TctC
MPQVQSGKLIGLAVTSARRSPNAVELPMMSEAGIAGYAAAFGQGLLAPKGTPPAVVATLNEALGAVLVQADVRNKMLAMDLDFIPTHPSRQRHACAGKQTSGRWSWPD